MLERQQLKMLNMNAYQIVKRKKCRFEKGVRTMFSQFANEYIQVKMYVFHLCLAPQFVLGIANTTNTF